jgi:transcriptional regulator with XRE-family HTH domain
MAQVKHMVHGIPWTWQRKVVHHMHRMPPVAKPRPKHRTLLRQWRKHRKLTLEAAAGKMGVDPSTLGRVERGLTPYDQRILEAAASVFGCKPADLLTRNPESPTANLWDTVESLPEAQQRLIAGMIRGFLDSMK